MLCGTPPKESLEIRRPVAHIAGEASAPGFGQQTPRAPWVDAGETLRIVVRVIGFNLASAHPRLTGNQAPKA